MQAKLSILSWHICPRTLSSRGLPGIEPSTAPARACEEWKPGSGGGFTGQPGELFQQLLLLLGEIGGNLDKDLDDLVPAADALEVSDALALQAEDLAALCPLGDFDGFLAVDGRHFDRGPQGGLGYGNGDLAEDVIAFALEKLVGLHVDEDIEVPAGASEITFLAFAAQSQAGARLNAGGDPEADGLSRFGPPGPVTGLAWVLDDASGAPAVRAGGADGEEAARLGHGAAPGAAGTCFRLSPCCRS